MRNPHVDCLLDQWMILFTSSTRLGGWMRLSSAAAAGSGLRKRQIQSILWWQPNGDWTRSDVVEVLVPPGRECGKLTPR